MIRLLSARCAPLILVISCAAPCWAQQPEGSVPVPAARPADPAPAQVAQPEIDADQSAAKTPVPTPKGRPKAAGDEDTQQETAAPDKSDPSKDSAGRNPVQSVFKAPVPKWRPEPATDGDVAQQTAEPEGLPVKEAACRDRLTAMGVRFTPADRIDGEGGCGIGHPIRVTWLPQQVKLSGRAIMGCEVSESLANWTVKVAIPQAKLKFGEPLTEIEQYASYVCRSRNSLRGARLSEHAKGNAIDLGRFHMADGTVVDVASQAEDNTPEKRFLKVLRDEGCTYFKTVLGPGSDPYHSNHFHFDMAKRRNGSHYCR